MIKFDIRTKLTVQFSIIASLVIIAASAVVYSISSAYREDEFYLRLFNKGLNVVKLLIEEDKVDAELLSSIENNNPVNLPQEEILIFDSTYQAIFSKPNNIQFLPDVKFLRAIEKDSIARLQIGPREVGGFVFKNNNKTYIVIASAVDVYGYRKLRNLLNTLVVVVISCLFVFLIAGRIFAQQALAPIKKIVEEVEQINVDNLNTQLKVEKEDEIGALAQTFNNMLFRIDKAFFAQKNFVANASHELKTPLTAIRGQLEVSLMLERDSKAYKQTIQTVLDEVINLGEITNNLLLLAYADTFIKDEIFKPLRIDEVLWSVHQSLLNLKPEYILEIDIDQEIDSEDQLTMLGNDHLLRIVFMNIIDNACKYSEDHKVSIQLKSLEHRIQITFKDNGRGIEQQEIPNITELFYRSRNNPSIDGHGIGLSLVEKITSIHKGELRINSALHKGTEVQLIFSIYKINPIQA
jgi:signal transduction histidine kinase